MENEAKQPMDGNQTEHWADLVKFFRANFNTLLGHEEEWRFHVWMDACELGEMLDDYDLRGAWQKDPANTDEWPAEFRKPNHVLFDTSSRYHGTPDTQHGEEYVGGTWKTDKEGELMFSPSEHMLETTHPQAWLAAQMRTNYPAICLCIPEKDGNDE